MIGRVSGESTLLGHPLTFHGRQPTQPTPERDCTAAKRAGTDYPENTGTASPTGGGLAGETVGTRDATESRDATHAGTCTDRVCVIKR